MFFIKIFREERLFIFIVVLAALLFALTAEHVLELAPCPLCMYQRYFFLGLLLTCFFKNLQIVRVLFLLSGISLSLYHLGLEQTWWVDILHTCHINLSGANDLASFRAQFATEVQPACGEMPWHILGVSVIIWTLLLQLTLLLYIGWMHVFIKKTSFTS